MWYFSFSVWLTSLGMIISRPTHVATNGNISFFFMTNALVIANTLFQQHKRRLDTWTSPGGQHRNQIDYLCSQRWRSSNTVSKNKTRSWLWLRHELLIAKFRLKLKKVEKTTRPFRYNLNQIPYDYTVEVINRFKELDVIQSMPDELRMEVPDTVQETEIKIIPKKNKCKKSKRAVWGGLTNSCEKKRSEKQRRKGTI